MDKNKDPEKIVELRNVREHYRSQAFRMMIEVAFIFGIPAIVAFFLGRKLDLVYGSEKTILLSLLAVAFVFSWVVVIFKYRKLDKELRKVDEAIKEELENQRKTGLLKETKK